MEFSHHILSAYMQGKKYMQYNFKMLTRCFTEHNHNSHYHKIFESYSDGEVYFCKRNLYEMRNFD